MHAYGIVKLLRKTVFVGDFCTMHLTRDVDFMMYTMIHTTMTYIGLRYRCMKHTFAGVGFEVSNCYY